ncbi:MAG: acyl-CoA thioesterase [Bacteroidales bacterium]|nr:acyl-CoA thioesterase [Bacteroidales bacterium]
MDDTKYTHSVKFMVRDYELDSQSVVNNANYLHYLEHARYDFLVSKGINFDDLRKEGIDLVVARVEIEYKYPLRSGNNFVVRMSVSKEGNIRMVFIQDIFRLPDEKLIARAKVTGVAVIKGKPVRPKHIFEKVGIN